jgi:hypothetical protein
MLDQALRMVGISALHQFVTFAGSVGQLDANVVRKVKWADMLDRYADTTGVDPDLMVGDEEYQAQMAQVAQDQRNMALAAQYQAGGQAAKTMSETKMQQNSMLDALMGSDALSEMASRGLATR